MLIEFLGARWPDVTLSDLKEGLLDPVRRVAALLDGLCHQHHGVVGEVGPDGRLLVVLLLEGFLEGFVLRRRRGPGAQPHRTLRGSPSQIDDLFGHHRHVGDPLGFHAQLFGLLDDNAALGHVVDDEDHLGVGRLDLEHLGAEILAAHLERLRDQHLAAGRLERRDKSVLDADAVVVVDVHDRGFLGPEGFGDLDPFQALGRVRSHGREEVLAAVLQARRGGDAGDLDDLHFLRLRAQAQADRAGARSHD